MGPARRAKGLERPDLNRVSFFMVASVAALASLGPEEAFARTNSPTSDTERKMTQPSMISIERD